MTIRSLLASTLTIAAATMFAAAAHAEMISLSAELSGKNEVPPLDGSATGMAEATLDTDTRTLTYKITYEGLSGPVIGSHLHGPVGADANAGILIPFIVSESPIEGTAELTEEQIGSILDGLSYVNIHTDLHPGGEMRGQLQR
ncbi:MAG: CHRD domain-containing protein [Rhizobiaceae bacterium]|nr:CHRD domain-containing protein [Rhizobiaceae bacterium]